MPLATPAEPLSRVWEWERGGNRQQGPERADLTLDPLLTSVFSLSVFLSVRLSLSVSVWETETIGKRNLGEDRLLIICPSGRSLALTAGSGWGGNERLIRGWVHPTFPPPPPSLAIWRWGRHRKMELLVSGCS